MNISVITSFIKKTAPWRQRNSKPVTNNMIYLLTAIALTPGSSSTAHIYTQTIYRTT